MTTTILSVVDQKPLRVDADPSMVVVDLVNSDESVSGGCYDRDLFLDLFRSELGVLIIDKADLPIVTDREVHGNLFVADVPWAATLTVEALRQEAYDRLALAEYLEAHPPVDEQQVEALAGLIETQKVGVTETAKDVARRLLSTGKVTVQS